MVVERIAACPIDEVGLGVGAATPVVVEVFSAVQEQVGDPGDRDEVGDRVLALGETGEFVIPDAVPDETHGAVAESDAASRAADLSEHGCQRTRRPVGLLAVV